MTGGIKKKIFISEMVTLLDDSLKWFEFIVDDGKTLKQLHDRHFSPPPINYRADVHRYLLSVWMPLRLIFSSLKFSSFTIVFN